VLAVQILEGEKDIELIANEWNTLHETISPRLPFSTPLWVLSWWHHYKRAAGVASDRLCVFTFRDSIGELLAVAPMVITARPGYGPFRSKELQFIGSDSNVTEVRGPLCRPSHVKFVTSTIIRIMQETRLADWIQWRGLRCETGKVPAHIQANKVLSTSMYILNLPGSWNEFRASLPRNMKEALRKCYNSLTREEIKFTVEVAHRPDQVQPALSRFFALHELRSNARTTVFHPNVFEAERSRKFLHEYCLRMARQGTLRIFQLVISGEVVACRIAFQFERELYLYYSGCDPKWGRFSISTTVVAEAIKWAIDRRLSIVNLSSGMDVSKTRWRPECFFYFGGISTRLSLSSQLKQRVFMRLRGWKNSSLQQGDLESVVREEFPTHTQDQARTAPQVCRRTCDRPSQG
jgi:CelD/BcsL family acetyltransferase involved in cellulose biosynthesis